MFFWSADLDVSKMGNDDKSKWLLTQADQFFSKNKTFFRSFGETFDRKFKIKQKNPA